MAKPINLYEAKTQLSKLVDRAATGEEIIIAKAGRPLAKLVQYRTPGLRVPGRLRGVIELSDDFDAPLPEDILAAFEGRSDSEVD